MPVSAKITVTTLHQNSSTQSQVSDEIPDVGKGSLSGSADDSGPTTDKTVPNGAGGSDQTNKTAPLPAGKTAGGKKVSITMTCANNRSIMLEDDGNVSVSGKVDGECITTTSVNRSTDTNGVITTTTSTKRKCCADPQNASFVTPEEFIAFKSEILALLRAGADPADPAAWPNRLAWLGFSPLDATGQGVIVDRLLPRSPVAKAGLVKGDLITKLGETPVKDLASLREARTLLRAHAPVSIDVFRHGEPQRLQVWPGMPIFLNRDVAGDVLGDKTCDDQCTCAQAHDGAVCSSYWRYRGPGPYGGMLYEMTCTAFGRNLEVISDKNCGVAEYI